MILFSGKLCIHIYACNFPFYAGISQTKLPVDNSGSTALFLPVLFRLTKLEILPQKKAQEIPVL